MIAKATTHGDGAVLARYLITGKDRERAELWDLRGFAFPGIVDAFRSVHAIAAGTKCQAPFFHVCVRNREGEVLDREQWEYTANRIERILGLKDQPRAIAFHIAEDTGHLHMHVAWSRIDPENLIARPLPFYKQRLKRVSRELEGHFGLTPVRNERESSIQYAPTRAEDEQARRLGLNIHDTRETIRSCFVGSNSGRRFQAMLAQVGLTLARGDRRDFLVMDRAGGTHALGKRLLGVAAAKIRDCLADLSSSCLPTVQGVRGLIRKRQGEHIESETHLTTISPSPAEINECMSLPALGDGRADIECSREVGVVGAQEQSVLAAAREPPAAEHTAPLVEPEAEAAGKVLESESNIAGEAFEILGHMFGATTMMPERIQAALDARDKAAEEHKIDPARFLSDADCRRQCEAREAQKIDEERSRYHEQQKERERGR